MKSMTSVLLGGMLAAIPAAMAQQQLPNPSFEGKWSPVTPWTFYQDEASGEIRPNTVDSITSFDDDWNTVKIGLDTPEGWVISNVAGMVGENTALGATMVGFEAEGVDGGKAVNLVNNPNPFMATQIVPAYINLGTTWSTAMPSFSFTGIEINNADGGVWGGMEFNGRPSALEFMYKRSRATAPEDASNPETYKPEETTTVVAYLWKGHWTQKDVPVSIVMVGDPVKMDMVDRDRCVLDMLTEKCQGGEVTKSDDAELIGKLVCYITEDASEWTKFRGEFEYFSDATPEYINVILSAGDYFGGAEAVGVENALVVDDVKLIYDEVRNEAVKYDGYVNIEMMGSILAENAPSTIEITPTGEGKCDFLLPNFSLGEDMVIGDIFVQDVTVTKEGTKETYVGSVKGLSLLEGAIIADVDINGTVENGVIDMKIDVVWEGVPINVTFTGNLLTGIGSIEAAEAPVEYYNLQGVRMNADNLTPGIYVKRQGNKTVKVVVK